MTAKNLIKTSAFELSTSVRRDLRERLLSLNFHAFAQCMALVIETMGGEDVRLSGRQNWRGRNRHGGYDLEATLPTAFGKRRAIIQVKQYDALPVYQRTVDELRGTCLRIGASEAILITTGTFAASVDRSLIRLQETSVAPVRLIDGETLLDLMVAHRIGVWDEPGSTAGESARQGVDTKLFEELVRSHEGNSRLNCGTEPRFVVSVQVRPIRRRSTPAHRSILPTGGIELQTRC